MTLMKACISQGKSRPFKCLEIHGSAINMEMASCFGGTWSFNFWLSEGLTLS